MANQKTIEYLQHKHTDLLSTQAQSWFDALLDLPDGIIDVAANYGDSRDAKAILNKALAWKDRLLNAYPDLASKPAQFIVALESPEHYMMDRSGGKAAAEKFMDVRGMTRR